MSSFYCLFAFKIFLEWYVNLFILLWFSSKWPGMKLKSHETGYALWAIRTWPKNCVKRCPRWGKPSDPFQETCLMKRPPTLLIRARLIRTELKRERNLRKLKNNYDLIIDVRVTYTTLNNETWRILRNLTFGKNNSKNKLKIFTQSPLFIPWPIRIIQMNRGGKRKTQSRPHLKLESLT
jgi:hypothetical protein